LLIPMKIPDTMTAGISTARLVVQMAMISTTTAKASNTPPSARRRIQRARELLAGIPQAISAN